MSDQFKTGDRVIVTDLRTGRQEPAVVASIDGDGRLIVSYDNGGDYRVGRGFVRTLVFDIDIDEDDS